MSISVSLNEGGSGVVSVALTDHAGTALAIGDITGACWQLMRGSSIVNNRSFANSPLTALEWPLTSADLASPGTHTIAFKAFYSSVVGGALVDNLVVNYEDTFVVTNLRAWPITA